MWAKTVRKSGEIERKWGEQGAKRGQRGRKEGKERAKEVSYGDKNNGQKVGNL